MKTKIDSVIANVYNLDEVLTVLNEQLHLKPFYQSTINLRNHVKARMALISLLNADLEFIECAEHPKSEHLSAITEVHILSPALLDETHLELEAGLRLRIIPGVKTTLRAIETQSNQSAADSDVLLHVCSNCCESPLPDGGKTFKLNDVSINFQQIMFPDSCIPQPEKSSAIHGWQRIAFKFEKLEDSVALLEKAGATTVVPIFQVMPGLREAMMGLPSGIMIQPVEQNLLKMMLNFIGQKLSKRSGRGISQAHQQEFQK
jgi:hypothetical protein